MTNTAPEPCESNFGKTYESDDEIHIDLNATEPEDSQCSLQTSHGVVISGEAPESDEEIDSRPQSGLPLSASDYSLNESWNRQWGENSGQSDVSKDDEKLKHNTLLHKKLRERNHSLRKSLIEMACQPYQSASKEIHGISQQLIKSQLLVQEVTSTLRRLTNELFVLEDRVQSIKTGSFLPDIDIDEIQHVETP